MAGPKGNSEFCFPEAKPRGTLIEVEGKQNSRFLRGQSLSVFLYLLKKLQINPMLYVDWLTNFPRFQGTRPDHVRVKSLHVCCCFPGKLVSFVCPRDLESFNPRHVTRFTPIGKRI